MGRIIISIQSFSDIITNSSSEVFIINTPSDIVQSVVKDILSIADKNYENGDDEGGGMGGEFKVYTWENGFKMYKHRHKHTRNNPEFTPQMWADEIGIPLEKLMSIIVIDMDWCRNATREYLITHYNAKDEEVYFKTEPLIDFIDGYESYSSDLKYREDFDSDDEYELYLLMNME